MRSPNFPYGTVERYDQNGLKESLPNNYMGRRNHGCAKYQVRRGEIVEQEIIWNMFTELSRCEGRRMM